MGIHRKVTLVCTIWMAVSYSSASSAVTLSEAYHAALLNDPYFQSSYHAYQAGKEDENIAFSNLLPQVSLSVRKTRNDGSREFGTTNSPLKYTSSSNGLYLRQPLLNLERLAMSRQGKLQADISEQQFRSSNHEVILRTASTYLDVVVAKVGVKFAQASVRSAESLYQQAMQMQVAGESTEVEIDTAKARLRLAEVQRMEYVDKLSEAQYILAELTQLSIDDVATLDLDRETSNKPTHPIDTLISEAMSHNPVVQENVLALDLAAENKNKTNANYYPSLDLIASYSENNQENPSLLGQRYLTRTIGLEMQWPLFNGGQTMAVARKNQSQIQQARSDVLVAQTKIRIEVGTQYRNAISALEKTKALADAKKASERGLAAIQKGVASGIRTQTEVLSAEKELAQIELEHADALRTYFLSMLKLNAARGELREEELLWIESYLIKSSHN